MGDWLYNSVLKSEYFPTCAQLITADGNNPAGLHVLAI